MIAPLVSSRGFGTIAWMQTDRDLLAILLNDSRQSQQHAMLQHMANERNLRKQIGELFDQWIDEAWKAELFRWFIEYGDDLAAALKAGPDIFALPKRKKWRPTHPAWRRLHVKKLRG